VVAVPMDARRRDQAGQRGEKFEGREDEERAAIGRGAQGPVEDVPDVARGPRRNALAWGIGGSRHGEEALEMVLDDRVEHGSGGLAPRFDPVEGSAPPQARKTAPQRIAERP